MGRYMTDTGIDMDEDYMTGADMDDVMYMTNDDMTKVMAITDHVMDNLITDASLRKGIAGLAKGAWRGVKSAAGQAAGHVKRVGNGVGESFDNAEDGTVGAGKYVRNRFKAVGKAISGKDEATINKREMKKEIAAEKEYAKLVDAHEKISRSIASHPRARSHKQLLIDNGGGY